MKKISYISAFALLSLSLSFSPGASAQNLDETFDVEGVYDVKINKQERIAHLPTQLELKMSQPSLQYSATGVPVNVQSFLTPLKAAAWEETYDYDKDRGYLDFGMGSYFDICASAGARLVDKKHTRLGVRLQHNSSVSFQPFKTLAKEKDINSRKLFDEYIGLYGMHDFYGIGRLEASLDYRLGYFNYYGLVGETSPLLQPSQTTNTLDFSARLTSERDRRLLWNAGVEYNYYGYRRMYLADGTALSGLKQNILTIDGGAAYLLSSDNVAHNIGMDLRADIVMFAGADASSLLPKTDNYSRFCLRPHYTFSGATFAGRIGARIDLLANAGPEGDKYPVFRIAPDINAGFRTGKLGLGAHIGGGVELNTLQRNAALYRYTTPWLGSTSPIYSPLDASLYLDLGSFKGLSARLGVAYKITDGQPLEGTYMQYMTGELTSPLPGTIDIKGYSLQAGLKYVCGKLFEIGGDLSFQPQNGTKGYFNGLDRPRWVVDAKLNVTPLKGLRVEAGYQFRGVRSLYGLPNAMLAPEILTYQRLPNVSDLSVGVSYTVLPRLLTLWVRADNLLGKDAYLNPLLPEPGLAIMGGVELKF